MGVPLRVVAIDVQENAERARVAARHWKLSGRIALDDAGDAMRAYGVRTFPTTVLIGPDGRARLFHEGALANADVVLDPLVRTQSLPAPATTR